MENIKEKGGFFKSDLYLILVTAVVLLSWSFGVPLAGLAVFVIIIIIMTCTQKTAVGFLPLLATCNFLFNDKYAPAQTIYIVFIAVAVVTAITCGVIFLIKTKAKPKFSAPVFGFLLVFITAALGGVTEGYTGSSMWFIGIGLTGITGLAFFLMSGLIAEFDGKYIAKIFFWVSVIIIIETFIYYYRQEDILKSILKKDIDLGWGLSNNAALVLIMVSPLSLYLAAKSKFPLLYIAIFFLSAVTVFVTLSRGSILALTLCITPVLATTVRLSRKPVVTFFMILAVCAALFAGLYLLKDYVMPIIENLKGKGLDENGRFSLWGSAIKDYLNSNLFFGAGFGYGSSQNIHDAYIFYCHNTYLQMLFNFGIVGLAAFLFHIGQRVYYLIKNKTKFNLFILWGTIMAGMYGLLDVTYYMPYFLFPMLIFLLATYNGRNIKPPQDELLR